MINKCGFLILIATNNIWPFPFEFHLLVLIKTIWIKAAASITPQTLSPLIRKGERKKGSVVLGESEHFVALMTVLTEGFS